MLLTRTGRRLLNDAPFSRWISSVVALTLAFAPSLWSQATIAEVNALGALFAAAIFAALFSNSRHRLDFAASIIGLALTHHLASILLFPSAIIILSATRYTRQQYARAAILALTPLVIYAYLPIAARTHPPVNWGDPESLEQFIWVVTGGPYRSYLFALPLADLVSRVGAAANYLFAQFTIVGVILGLWGGVRMAATPHSRRAFFALLLAFGLTAAFAITYNSLDSFVYLVPAYIVFAIWTMAGAADALGKVSILRSSRTSIVFAGCLVLLPLYNLSMNFDAMNLSSDFSARDYAQQIIERVPANALIISDGDEHYFSLMYYRYVIARKKSQFVISNDLLQYDWYFENIRLLAPNLHGAPLNPADRVAALVDAYLTQGRSIFATAHTDALSPFDLEPYDGFYRVVGRPN